MDSKSILQLAYEEAREILRSKGSSGFRFYVTMQNGQVFDVLPLGTDSLTWPKGGFTIWPCQRGDFKLFIRHADISTIEVYET